MSLAAAIDLLACPRCGGPLVLDGQVRCSEGHAYDVAKQGYVNLSGGPQPRNADTTAMVEARTAFLAEGHYAAIAAGLAAAVPSDARTVLDAGAGPGYYAARVLDAHQERRGLALDVSVAACRRASRAHPRLAAAVADVWRPLPVRDAEIDAVLSVFAPRQPAEFARVLRPGGVLITVTPAPAHLAELRAELDLLAHDADKAAQLALGLADRFEHDEGREVVERPDWDAGTVRRSVLMGPNAFHQDPAALDARLARLRWPRTVTVSVRVDRWLRRD